MPPAVIGGVIAGVGAIGSAVIGSKAASKAANAQAQASDRAAEVQKEIYEKNIGFQTPYLNTGNAAMAQMNALLGLQVPQAQSLPTPVPGSGATPAPTVADPRRRPGFFVNAEPQQQTATPAPQMPTVTQPTAQAAYDQFKNYTGYQSRLAEANNGLNSAYAARGTLQSGKAMADLSRLNQDYASREFGNYMAYLGGQQQLGPGAANALAGVGTNYANASGAIAMNQGNNAANAAIAQGNLWGNAINGVAGGLGTIFGSSYGGR